MVELRARNVLYDDDSTIWLRHTGSVKGVSQDGTGSSVFLLWGFVVLYTLATIIIRAATWYTLRHFLCRFFYLLFFDVVVAPVPRFFSLYIQKSWAHCPVCV